MTRTIGKTIKKVTTTVKKAVSSVGSKSQGANALQATAIPGSISKVVNKQPVKPLGTVSGKTYYPAAQKEYDVARKGQILRAGTTGIISTLASQGNKVQAANNNLINKFNSGSLSKNSSSRSGGSSQTPTREVSGASTIGLQSLYGGQSSLSNTQGLGGIGGSYSNPTTNVVNTPLNVNTIRPTPEITLPEKTIQDFSQLVPTPVEQPVVDATTGREKSLQDYLDTILNDAPDSADAYAKAQRETDILRKQQVVNDLTGQLNGIVNRGQANQLSLVGQGRGIPEAIIGGQQAQIGRETAIAALPVQAQLSAAQGNLEMANDNLDTLFKIYSDDAKNEYEYKREVKKAIYEFATEKEKRALEKADKQEERAYQEKKDVLATNKTIAMEAAKNGASAGVLTKISNATSLAEAISAAGSYMLDTQVVKLDNGNTVVVDGQGRVIRNLGGASASTGNNFVVTQDILKNTYGNDVVSLIANTIKTSGAKQSQSTNDAINVISGLQQLVKDAPDGVFKGLAPVRLLPNKAKSTEALTNLSNIEAVNLKVQQWASGAALTTAQTKSVEKMTPRRGDTDKQVVAKTNALANYMVSQVSGQLAGQGVGFSIDKVNLFTKTPEMELKELYQNPTTKSKIQQAVQMFPTYTDAEILQIVR